MTTEKDLNADRKLSKLDVRSPFSRIHSSGSSKSLSKKYGETHILSMAEQYVMDLIYGSGTFLQESTGGVYHGHVVNPSW